MCSEPPYETDVELRRHQDRRGISLARGGTSTKPVVTLRGKSEAARLRREVGAYVGSDPQGDTVGEDAEGYWAVRPAGQPAIRIGRSAASQPPHRCRAFHR